MDMTGTHADRPERRTTGAERLFVLGGFAVAALWTAASLATGAGVEVVGPLWLAALAWTVLASFAGALNRGLRHRDRSAFGRYRLPDGADTGLDMDTRTGMYAYLRDEEDRLLHDDDWLR